MASLFLARQGDPPPADPIGGAAYLAKLHKYLTANAGRLSPSSSHARPSTILQQSYTLLTLGLDPTSAPLSRSLKVPLTLGFGTPAAPSPRLPNRSIKPLLLRLPPDRLLYLLLRWQSLPQALPHVGRTDVPIEGGVPVAARGARVDERGKGVEGDVRSVRSWVGSMRSVSMGSLVGKEGGRGWWGRQEEINEDQILLALYSMFTLLPALLIHPPFVSEPPILELIEAGGYTQLGGIDVRVPLDVLRNLSILELEGYDPRALLIPYNLNMQSLTVRDVQDGDDWVEELLELEPDVDAPNRPATSHRTAGPDDGADNEAADEPALRPRKARFPNLRHLSLIHTTLLSLPALPLSSLTHLDLSHNLLNAIPSSLSSLASLTSLNLSNNVITSLRSASTSLPSVISLNLSNNRIDCLVGLDRVPSLQRIDVRNNELLEVGEVGRLAVLPKIKEVWCSGNGFDIGGEDEWRVELGTTFKEEGKVVKLDDVEFTWNENRRIDALLASRGRTGQGRIWHDPSHSHPSHTGQPSSSSTSTQEDAHLQTHSRQSSTRSHLGMANVASPSSHAAVGKKKGKRRVISLDGTEGESDLPSGLGIEGSLRGSLRLPGRVDEEDESDKKSVDIPSTTAARTIVESEDTETRKNGTTGSAKTVRHEDPPTNNIPTDGQVPKPKPGDQVTTGDADQSGNDKDPIESTPIVVPANGQSIKVVSSKRKTGRKGLKKNTFDPIV